MSEKLAKATVIDGIAATEDRDSQNEILNLTGADISDMTKRGYFNDNHGSGFSNTLGRITYAKKIFKEADCTNDREKMYWGRVKRPFLYTKGYLFDDADHPNAKSVAAIMKEFQKMGTPLDVQMSVEGKVKQRDNTDATILKESMIRNVALTLVPANKSTGAQVLSEDAKKSILYKCKEMGGNIEYADTLMKSLQANSQTIATLPGFIEVVEEVDPLSKVRENVAMINKLIKGLSAGYGASGAPSSRVDGGALMGKKKTAKKMKAVTFEDTALGKKKKEMVLKSLIRKAKEKYPDLSYEEVVENVLSAFHNRLKGE